MMHSVACLVTQLALAQAVLLDLLGQEIALSDGELFFLRVPGDLDDLEPVSKRGGDTLERVRCADKEHVREVIPHVEVVILEGLILLRIEDLEQGS